MPMYEYHCLACDHTFDHLVRSMHEKVEAACPQCGSRQTERQLSVFAAHQGSSSQGCGLMPEGLRCNQCPAGTGGACSL